MKLCSSLRISLLVATIAAFSTAGIVRAATNFVAFGGTAFTFRPSSLTINVGDTVIWTNAGGSHTVTGDGSDSICGSGTVPTSCSHTYTTAGTFPYHCIPHQSRGMTGVVIVVATANLPPQVALTMPTNNASFTAGANITLQADATDSGGSVAKVEFFADTTLLGTATAAPYTFTWTAVPAGSYTLTAKATDNLGATTTSAAVRITVSAANIPPTVAITNPTNNASFTAGANITLQADATDSDGSVAKVEYFEATTLLGSATTAPYTVTWTNVAVGTYSLTATATDNSGATATSSAVNISVLTGTNSPVALLDLAIQGSSFNFSFATQSGVSYLVQFTESLEPINWQVLTNFSGNGATRSLTDTATAVQRFYRVSAQ